MSMNFSDFADFVAQVKRAIEIEQEVGDLEKHLADTRASMDGIIRDKEAAAVDMAAALADKAKAEEEAKRIRSDAFAGAAVIEDGARKAASKISDDALAEIKQAKAEAKAEADQTNADLAKVTEKLAAQQKLLDDINSHIDEVKARIG